MQILGLLGMYFDAVEVEVEKSLLFFRLALAILRNFAHLSTQVSAKGMKIWVCNK